MALPLHDHHSRTLHRRRSARPSLVVIEGGRRSSDEVRSAPMVRRRSAPLRSRATRSAPAAVYRRRRLAVAATAAALCVAVSLGAARLDGAGAGAAPAPDVVVAVRSGDTLWSIARSLDTGRDTRSVVAELSAANGGEFELEAGQDLIVPGPLATHLSRR